MGSSKFFHFHPEIIAKTPHRTKRLPLNALCTPVVSSPLLMLHTLAVHDKGTLTTSVAARPERTLHYPPFYFHFGSRIPGPPLSLSLIFVTLNFGSIRFGASLQLCNNHQPPPASPSRRSGLTPGFLEYRTIAGRREKIGAKGWCVVELK